MTETIKGKGKKGVATTTTGKRRKKEEEESKKQKSKKQKIAVKVNEKLKKQCAVLAMIDSHLLGLAVIPNKGYNAEGRIMFKPTGMSISNIDATVTQMVDTCLYAEAFSYYHCAGEEILVDLSLEMLIKEINKMTKEHVPAVISVPHCQREDGQYGPLSIQFQREEGEEAMVEIKSMDLTMKTLQSQERDWEYDFCISQTQFKRVIQQLCTDTTADEIALTLTPTLLTLQNNNGEVMCSKNITIYADKLPSYHFHPADPAHKKSIKVLFSREKMKKMLEVPHTGKLMLQVHGDVRLIRVQYQFEEEVGFIRFVLATKTSEQA